MAAERKSSSSPVSKSAVNLSFSMDSLQLGDSTRSLLSPLYDSDHESLKEQSFHSESEEDLSEGEIVDKSESRRSVSDNDHSETVTVKQAKRDSLGYESKDNQANNSYSSSSFDSSLSSTSSSSSSTPKKSQRKFESEFSETELSPWEKWLLATVIKDQQNAKIKIKKKLLDQEMSKRIREEKTEQEKKAELKRNEWLQLKNREEKVKNKLKKRQENEKVCKEEEEKERIQEKAIESYKKWSEMKKRERKELIKNRNKKECLKRENENEREQRSKEAYKEWLTKMKKHRKLTNNHFGYLSGRVTGYYDWTCYPMPSYNNPNPWVSPKIKKNYRGKLELQNPSPPLLFKELEERERMSKQKNSKLKKKGVC